MPEVSFTSNLKRFFPTLETTEVQNLTINEILDEVNNKYPGIKDYIVDEHGQLRKHVNIFIDNELIKDKEFLSDKVQPGNSVYFMQALSGG